MIENGSPTVGPTRGGYTVLQKTVSWTAFAFSDEHKRPGNIISKPTDGIGIIYYIENHKN